MSSNPRIYDMLELVDDEDVNTTVCAHAKYWALYVAEVYAKLESNNVEVKADIQWTSLADVVTDASSVNQYSPRA